MRAFADNSQERQSRAIANEPEQRSRPWLGKYMVDNRPEMTVQRKMVEMARKYGEQKALQRKSMFTSSKEAVQKKGPEDEDELQFKAKDAVQLKGPEDEDELQFKAIGAVQKKGPEDEDELQFKAEEPVQKKENRTGLPDDLKAGVENLSGLAMDDVRVHYNSGKPAQLNAYAYTQGTEIHVAPGQEKHLPHEAWHVVQQKQGRVQPTMQMAGGVAVNDDKGLEAEADLMERNVLQMKAQLEKPKGNKSRAVANSVVRQGFGLNLIQMQPMDQAAILLAIENGTLAGATYLINLYSLQYRHHNNYVIFLRSTRGTLNSDAQNAIRWYRCMTSGEFDMLNRNNRFFGDSYGGIAPSVDYVRGYLNNNSGGTHVVEFSTPNDGYLYNLFTQKGPKWNIKAEGGGTFGLGPTGNAEGEAGALFNNLLARGVISWELVDLKVPNPDI